MDTDGIWMLDWTQNVNTSVAQTVQWPMLSLTSDIVPPALF